MQRAREAGPVAYGPQLTEQWASPAYPAVRSTDRDEECEDDLPKDPRQWTREDVAHWLEFTSSLHRLPRVSPNRFLMNGKALCLMTPNMFLYRVPIGGKLLYKDFQLRLCSAMYTID